LDVSRPGGDFDVAYGFPCQFPLVWKGDVGAGVEQL
jgi:hypothetical protein